MVPHPKANVFATLPEEAGRGALSVVTDGVTGATVSGIRSESVAALMYALFEKDYEPGSVDENILGAHEIVHVYTKDHGGWLFRFPDSIVQMLADISEKKLESIARRWSLIFEYDGPPLPEPGEITGMLLKVMKIAQTALKQQLAMYWLQEGC